MENQASNKRKAHRGNRQGVQRGMSRTYARWVQKYFDCLLEGTPWELRNGETEDLSVEIIEGVLNDPNNAAALAIQNHPSVGRLIEH
eukprot:4565460-Prymnesium_polylepis.1